MAPFDPFQGELVRSNVPGNHLALLWRVDYQISPVAANSTGVLANTALTALAQVITTGLTNPIYPRNAVIKGNVSGITGNVVVKGTDFVGAVITETIALNGTAVVAGAKAFATVTEVDLPVQVHVGVAQVATATLVGTCTGSGNASVVVTAAGMAGSPKTYGVAVLNSDTPTIIAGKVAAVLAADPVLTAMYTVANPSGAATTVVLTSVAPQSNDSTLNIATATGTATGITTEASSAATTAGVPYDLVSVGVGSVLGLPYTLAKNMVAKAYNNNVLESTPPTVTFDAVNISGNTVTLATSLAGNVVDILLDVPG